MKHFTISDLERLSGVKAHTLRIWERRYALLQPHRTAGNARLYSLTQLEKLLEYAVLNSHGYRISDIHKMDGNALTAALLSLQVDTALMQKALAHLTVCMHAGRPDQIINLLNNLVKAFSLEVLVENILYPFLYNSYLFWKGNKLYEEHIAVTAIRQKLLYAIESLDTGENSSPAILLFLADTTQLDLGLLYSHFYFKKRGFKVLYLGNDITLLNLKSALQSQPFHYIFTYQRNGDEATMAKLLSLVTTCAPQSKLVMADYTVRPARPVCGNNIIQLPFREALQAVVNNVPGLA